MLQKEEEWTMLEQRLFTPKASSLALMISFYGCLCLTSF